MFWTVLSRNKLNALWVSQTDWDSIWLNLSWCSQKEKIPYKSSTNSNTILKHYTWQGPIHSLGRISLVCKSSSKTCNVIIHTSTHTLNRGEIALPLHVLLFTVNFFSYLCKEKLSDKFTEHSFVCMANLDFRLNFKAYADGVWPTTDNFTRCCGHQLRNFGTEDENWSF